MRASSLGVGRAPVSRNARISSDRCSSLSCVSGSDRSARKERRSCSGVVRLNTHSIARAGLAHVRHVPWMATPIIRPMKYPTVLWDWFLAVTSAMLPRMAKYWLMAARDAPLHMPPSVLRVLARDASSTKWCGKKDVQSSSPTPTLNSKSAYSLPRLTLRSSQPPNFPAASTVPRQPRPSLSTHDTVAFTAGPAPVMPTDVSSACVDSTYPAELMHCCAKAYVWKRTYGAAGTERGKPAGSRLRMRTRRRMEGSVPGDALSSSCFTALNVKRGLPSLGGGGVLGSPAGAAPHSLRASGQ
mmetsp:Transcript_31865/g.79917  ORF Transcript_31865/g.79917 Transcript_31865/m.79917 type:complete len:299 (+) Transcript_31865:409-1305(+)